jgi:hypothetical protein
LGDFGLYPFSLLSRLSLLTGSYKSSLEMLFMAGQHTAFNMDDPYLGSIWKQLPTLSTPEDYSRGLSGNHPSGVGDEGYWSDAYMRTDEVRIYPRIV